MTRTELLALAERLSAARVYGRDIEQIVDFLRQTAEAKPFVWYDDDTGETWTPGAIADGGATTDLRALYTLPLED